MPDRVIASSPPRATLDGALSPAAHILALVALLGLAAFVAVVNFWYAYDDVLITYRIARNFALGRGFVYNPGEWHMGTTAPLYGLLLGCLGRLTGPDTVPFWGGLISGISLALGGLALYAYGHRHRAPLAGALAGMFYVTNPMMFVTFGGEMPLQMALILWAFVAYRADRLSSAGALLACATLTRPDGILAAGVLGAYDLIVRRRVAWRAWLVFACILAPFVALAWIFYGSPLPGTLAAKLAQRDSGRWGTYGRGLRDWFGAYLLVEVDGPRVAFLSLDPGTLSFWTTVGVLALAAYRFWGLPLAWVALFVIAYRTLKVPFYHWYAAPALVGLSIVTGSGAAAVLSLARRGLAIWRSRSGGGAAPAGDTAGPSPSPTEGLVPILIGAGLVVLAGFPYLRTLHLSTKPPAMVNVYAEAGRWLHDETPPGSSVGYYEIGYVGYFSDRPLVDALGLIDPAVPPHVAKADFAWAFRQRRPTYLLEKTGVGELNNFLREPWFAQEYRERRRFRAAEDPQRNELVLYERLDAARPTSAPSATSPPAPLPNAPPAPPAAAPPVRP